MRCRKDEGSNNISSADGATAGKALLYKPGGMEMMLKLGQSFLHRLWYIKLVYQYITRKASKRSSRGNFCWGSGSAFHHIN